MSNLPPFDDTTLTGQILIAAPTMQDDRFRHSVVLLCDHDHEHAMGIVLNKPVPQLTLAKLLDQIGIDRAIKAPALPVMDGGPCQRDRGFVLHSDDWECEDSSLFVADGLRLTATRDVLTALTGQSAPAKALMALGFAGWGPGQLEEEIRANAWLIAQWSPQTVFSSMTHERAWRAALAGLGVHPMHLAGISSRA
jgi:putative transcriptional regulator